MTNTQSLKLKSYFIILLCFLLFSGCGAAWKAKPRSIVNNTYLSRIEGYLVKKPLRVTVVPLAYRDNSVSMKVTDIFISELSMIPIFSIVERNRLNSILQEQALGQTGIIDNETAVNLGQIVGAFRLVDTKTGVIIWSGNHTLHSGPLSVPDTLDSLVPFTIRELIDEFITKMKILE